MHGEGNPSTQILLSSGEREREKTKMTFKASKLSGSLPHPEAAPLLCCNLLLPVSAFISTINNLKVACLPACLPQLQC